MFTRYASAIASGTLITLAILYAMQGLITLMPGAQTGPRDRHELDWIHLSEDRRDAPAQIEEIDFEVISEAPLPPTGGPPTEGGSGFYIPVRAALPGPVSTAVTTLSAPDGPLIAIVRVQPAYPANAEQRGLEGWVDVRFDVMTNGLVANIEVIESSNRIFEKAAIKAAQRFRFKAPVVNGVPQVATGVDYRFRFTMNN